MTREQRIAFGLLCGLSLLLGYGCSGKGVFPSLASPTPIVTPVVVDVSLDLALEDIIPLADLIAIGQVEAIHPAQWNTPGGGLPEGMSLGEANYYFAVAIYTDVDFRISQVIKGQPPGDLVKVRLLGGQIGEHAVEFSGMPSLEIGTYLLFLSSQADAIMWQDWEEGLEDTYTITGWALGQYVLDGDRVICIVDDGTVWDERPLEAMLAYIAERATQTPRVLRVFSLEERMARLANEPLSHAKRGRATAELGEWLKDKALQARRSFLEGDLALAIRYLEEFIGKIQVERGQGITEAAADDLLVRAQAILNELSALPVQTLIPLPAEAAPADALIETLTPLPIETPTETPTPTPIETPTEMPKPTAE